MGCGAAKDVAEPQPVPGLPKDADKPRDEVPADPQPPLERRQIFELFTAGSMKTGTPPLYLNHLVGPYVLKEKVPPLEIEGAAIISVSSESVPPRVIWDVAPLPSSSLFSPSLNLLGGGGIFLRAFLPHSLSGYCTGWCKPDITSSELLPGFHYDCDVDGAADEAAIRETKPPSTRDVKHRRRILLFPHWIDAVGIFVSIDGVSTAGRCVVPYATDCVVPNDMEPIEGAFATWSLIVPATDGPRKNVLPSAQTHRQRVGIENPRYGVSAAAVEENSLSFTLLNSTAALEDAVTANEGMATAGDPVRRLADSPGKESRRSAPACSPVEAAFAKVLSEQQEGPHVLSFSVRFRYSTDTLCAVYDRPAAGATALRAVGTYSLPQQATCSTMEQLSDVIAKGDCSLLIDAADRARLRSWTAI